MTVKFKWKTGYMEIDADYVIELMPAAKLNKWLKLFKTWADTETKQEFLALVDKYIDKGSVKKHNRYLKIKGALS